MAGDINDELEFRERYNKLPPEEKSFWVPKEIYFLSKTVSKLSTTQDDINKRLEAVEKQCEPPGLSRKEKLIYGSGAGAGGIALLGWLAELITKWRGS
jgi:hypothetical protein